MLRLPEVAGVRKPPKEETACRKGVDVASAIYGDLRIASASTSPLVDSTRFSAAA
jgi:hypothetical protein